MQSPNDLENEMCDCQHLRRHHSTSAMRNGELVYLGEAHGGMCEYRLKGVPPIGACHCDQFTWVRAKPQP